MELVIAAAVLALGLVAAATLYGRGRLATANGGHAQAAPIDTRRRDAAAAIVGDRDLEALMLQQGLNGDPDRGVVVNDENA